MGLTVISALALVTSLLGNLLVNLKRRIGFLIWILSNVLWILANVLYMHNGFQVAMFIVYMLLNLHGYVLWTKSPPRR